MTGLPALGEGAPLAIAEGPVFPHRHPALLTPATAIEHAVRTTPDGAFSFVGEDGSVEQVSFAAMLSRARRILGGLEQAGLRPGAPVILHFARCEDFVPAIWATLLGGFVDVPFARNAWSRHRARTAGETLAHLGRVLGGPPVIGAGDDIAALRLESRDATLLDIDALAALPESTTPAANQPDRTAALVLTSATTGRPQLVALSASALAHRWWPAMPDADHANAFLSWVPFDHVMGLGFAAPNLRTKVYLPTRAFVGRPLQWLELIERHQVTHATMTNFGMGLVRDALMGRPAGAAAPDLSSLRKVGIGTEAIAPRLLRSFIQLLRPLGLSPDAPILGYGLTECGPVVGGATPFRLDDSEDDDPFPALDVPTAGHAIRIVGDDGAVLAEGEQGAIEVRGPTMTSGYFGDETATAALFTADGWLRTGDLGSLDDGRLTVSGRAKELIIINARKYSCAEIEAVAETAPDVHSAYATPLVADADGRERFAVFVVVPAAKAADFDNLATRIERRIASAFGLAPATILPIEETDIPRTASGKVRRTALAALAAPNAGPPAETPVTETRTEPTTDMEEAVAAIVERVLQCGPVGLHDDFFSLGGDSVAALQLVFELESRFRRPLPADIIHADTTIARLATLLGGSDPGAFMPAGTGRGRHQLVRVADDDTIDGPTLSPAIEGRLRSGLSTWSGDRPVRDGLIVAANRSGSRPALFWSLQGERELTRLAASLGPDQPLYGMRSGVLAMAYTPRNIAALAARYVEEIVAIDAAGPIAVGGNCQGGIIAIEIARQLAAAGRPPDLLVLVDTVVADRFAAGPCASPALLLYGRSSRLNPRRLFRDPELGWRKLFPAGLRTALLPCDHGEFFDDSIAPMLAEAVRSARDWAAGLPPQANASAGALPSSAYRARISLFKPIEGVAAGQSFRVRVNVRNRGSVPWEPTEASGIRLANHWLGEDGEMLQWADGRADLGAALAPDEKIRLWLTVRAPVVPGRYLLELDLVEEGVAWFKEMGARALTIPIEVAAS